MAEQNTGSDDFISDNLVMFKKAAPSDIAEEEGYMSSDYAGSDDEGDIDDWVSEIMQLTEKRKYVHSML